MKEIFERRSIRTFSKTSVDENIIKELLRAAIAAPSAHKKEPRVFYVIQNSEILKQFFEKHPYGKAFETAPLAILVCADKEKDSNMTFLIQDCAASLQNIALMATHYNMGSVWMGVLDNDNAEQITREIIDLPKNHIPISIMAIGYKDEERRPHMSYKEEMVKWIK
ncbi:nitroreductase family protein [Oceanivirga salmonicida]|uniref:nitroreductase family protein n=1 Tax=Oceanivirga salmonicida TaxID=1769291 RepID=UPI000836D799|nr:nitroreductase family protein [Oceanivirga salmonicida]